MTSRLLYNISKLFLQKTKYNIRKCEMSVASRVRLLTQFTLFFTRFSINISQ